jgi:hypothetical protein
MAFVGGVTPGLLLLAQTFCGGNLIQMPVFSALLAGSGLLIKLLLQPVHLGLVTFYKRLKFEALAGYVLLYYCFFIPAFVCVFATYLHLLLASSVIIFLALLLGAGLALSQGAAVGTDLRVALVFSTAINLTLLLLVIGAR